MEIGQKSRDLREAKRLSQGDMGRRSGLLQCYVSRVERGRAIPGVETLEKFANALGIPLYRVFTDGESVSMPKLPSTKDKPARQTGGKHHRELRLFAKAFDEREQKLLVSLAHRMATQRKRV
jgi:transcriptional regulator with XRE-family HTH domain